MDRDSGAALGGGDHLAQSVADILTTPIGTRVMRRDYGSLLFELIDAPFNALTRALLHAATALALDRWEPRLQLTRVVIAPGAAPGQVTLALEGRRLDAPEPNSLARLSIPLRFRSAAF